MTRPQTPLNALRAFEAAARYLSFTKAAEELHVTPAAVSQHVKQLEAQLGVPLFIRLTRALRLTEAGQDVLPMLSEGLDHLAEVTERLRAHGAGNTLTISVSPSFGAMWLVPRLDRFYAQHPEIEIRLDGTDRRVDVARGEADLAIRYGAGGYAGLRVDHLFDQRNTPVCSPRLLQTAALTTPQDLRHHSLLHVEWADTDASWRMWLHAAGVTGIDATKGPRFSQESMAVEAALDGQGVALLGDRLVADYLADGRLICPFDQALRKPLRFSYYMLTPMEPHKKHEVGALRQWLLDEAGQSFG